MVPQALEQFELNKLMTRCRADLRRHRVVTAIGGIVVVRIKCCLLLVFLASCSRDSSDSSVSTVSSRGQASASTRRWLPATFDTAWTLGGNDADTVLSFPARLISVDDLVIVSDLGNHRIIALRAGDGAIAWVNGPQRGHPFGRALIIWPQPGHRIGVADEATQHVTSIDTRGRTVGELDLDPSHFVNAMCALEGKDALVASTDALGPLYTLAADGKTATPVPLTVLDAKGRDPLMLQSSLEPTRDGTACVVAMSLGGGLALWNGKSIARATPYREKIPFPVPVMTTQVQTTAAGKTEVTFPTVPHRAVESALSVATVAGRVRVLFEGTTADKGRIIDDYDDRTLEYLGSVRLPFRVKEFATPASDLIVVLTKRNGFPMLVALRQRPGRP
jgi:hypothetical protein